MKTVRLENWSLFQARLDGIAFGHPRYADHTPVRTSLVVGKEGELVVTKSGTRYELGEPSRSEQRSREQILEDLPELSVGVGA